MKIFPVRLEPHFTPRPWGSHSLAPLFPEMTNLIEPIGEAWMTGERSRFAPSAVAGHPCAGRTLGDFWPEMPPEWTGSRVETGELFPLLVKFIFAEEKLSVQVHPDDAYAGRHEQAVGGRGKTEMWYTLRAAQDAAVLVGLKPHVNRASLEHAIAEGTAENLLEKIPLRPDDAVFIPPGTVHTIGPGLVICEIQQHSDLTYRLYDYNRRDAHGRARELHVEKGLDVTHFGRQGGGKLESLPPIRNGSLEETWLLACPYFVVERWKFPDTVDVISSREHFDLLIFLEGKGTIRWGNANTVGDAVNDTPSERTEYGPGQVWMIPAALGKYRLTPSEPTSLLRTYVPPSLDEFSAELTRRGVSAAQSSRIVHR